jgi:hypothetical protein
VTTGRAGQQNARDDAHDSSRHQDVADDVPVLERAPLDQVLENLPRMMYKANAMMAKTMRIVINKTGSPLCR